MSLTSPSSFQQWSISFCGFLLGQVLALVGDQLDDGDNICGAVLSIRFNEDILSVWNRNASDHQVCFHVMIRSCLVLSNTP